MNECLLHKHGTYVEAGDCICNPTTGETEKVDSRGSQAGQSIPNEQVQIQWEIMSPKLKLGVTEENTVL